MKAVNAKPLPRISAPRTMAEVTDRLGDLFAEIWNGETLLPRAKELSNTAGKLIKSVTARLEYRIARKEKPEIPFLE